MDLHPKWRLFIPWNWQKILSFKVSDSCQLFFKVGKQSMKTVRQEGREQTRYEKSKQVQGGWGWGGVGGKMAHWKWKRIKPTLPDHQPPVSHNCSISKTTKTNQIRPVTTACWAPNRCSQINVFLKSTTSKHASLHALPIPSSFLLLVLFYFPSVHFQCKERETALMEMFKMFVVSQSKVLFHFLHILCFQSAILQSLFIRLCVSSFL